MATIRGRGGELLIAHEELERVRREGVGAYRPGGVRGLPECQHLATLRSVDALSHRSRVQADRAGGGRIRPLQDRSRELLTFANTVV